MNSRPSLRPEARLPIPEPSGPPETDHPLYREAVARLEQLCRRGARHHPHGDLPMALATVDPSGRPAIRTVLLKGLDLRGLVFYTNLQSRKARHLAGNPRAALCLHWPALRQQVVVEGATEPVSEAEADAYWATRPRTSQLGAWASRQSEPLRNRPELLAALARAAVRFGGHRVPRPPHWSGYRVVPDRIEFWKHATGRLHERVVYERRVEGWHRGLLFP